MCGVRLLTSYPEREQLQTICSAYLQPVLCHGLAGEAAWASAGRAHQLAGSLVQVYEQVGAPPPPHPPACPPARRQDGASRELLMCSR